MFFVNLVTNALSLHILYDKMPMNTVKRNSFRAWMLAARPKTLTGAIVPVMIGSALAWMDDKFVWQPALICAVFAGLMQILANFINDLFDYLKGTDREDRLGPERACAQGWISAGAMKKGIAFVVILACVTGSMLLWYAGWELIIVGVVCVLFAFLYTTGPYPLSYNGWGDVLVVLFFGFVPVGGTYYVQALSLNAEVLVASLVCGLVVDTLLVINNYRDRDADRQSGKRTVVVRFGEPFGRYLYLLLGVSASLLCLFFLWRGHWYAGLLPQIYLIPHYLTWKRMVKIRSGKQLNSILGETSRNMLFMGILLSLAFLMEG